MSTQRVLPWRPNGVPKKRLVHIPGQLIVEIKPQARALALGPSSGNPLREPMEHLKTNAGMKRMVPLFTDPAGKRGGQGAVASKQAVAVGDYSPMAELGGFHVCHLDGKRITPALLKKLRSHPAFSAVEPMPARFISAGPGVAPDPETGRQWGLKAIKWFDIKSHSTPGIIVAVLDSGLDRGHPDLKNAVVDYHRGKFKAEDILGHGTHVAGVIGAGINNGVGIAGVAECKLEVWKVFPDSPQGDNEFYVDGPAYLQALGEVLAGAPRGVRVLNISITGLEESSTERVIFRALENAGVVVVAAIGNDFENGNPVYYPAAYEGVLAVGAVDSDLQRWKGSSTGAHIGLMAPGVSILSTVPRKKSAFRSETGYASWLGTSMAAPHVAGAAALYLANHPAASAAEVRKAITGSTRRAPPMGAKKFTEEYGSGFLDLHGLLG